MRLDKWLWAARFYKTRSLAVTAIEAGHVVVNAERAKPAKMLKVGDSVVVRRPPFEHAVVVKGLSERRGSGADAALLYEETAESREARERDALARRIAALTEPDPGPRPTKRDRRRFDAVKGRRGRG
jgi:ribosome-associated heat shock protein Hsp15